MNIVLESPKSGSSNIQGYGFVKKVRGGCKHPTHPTHPTHTTDPHPATTTSLRPQTSGIFHVSADITKIKNNFKTSI